MAKIVIRHDDFDFRMGLEDYKIIHEEFIKRDLIETAILQFSQYNRVVNMKPDVVEYLNTAPNYDLQLHGWTHHLKYQDVTYDEIVKDLMASLYMFQRYFNRLPTIWYPPWNGNSEDMQRAAKSVNLTIDNESNDIEKAIREIKNGTFNGHSVYFHGWRKPERDLLPELLDLIKDYECRRP